MAEAVRKFPLAGFSAAVLNGGAGVSREACDDHLRGCRSLSARGARADAGPRRRARAAAFQAEEGWLDRVRAGLMAVLEFFDEQPALARFLVVHSAQAGPAVLARRGDVLDRLALVLDYERAPARGYPRGSPRTRLSAGCSVSSHGRLSKPDPGSLVDLAGPLMSFIVLPFFGARAARRELSRPLDDASVLAGPSAAMYLLHDPARRVNRRTVSVLRVIGSEPGLSNREVALRAGITGQSQISQDPCASGPARADREQARSPDSAPSQRVAAHRRRAGAAASDRPGGSRAAAERALRSASGVRWSPGPPRGPGAESRRRPALAQQQRAGAARRAR